MSREPSPADEADRTELVDALRQMLRDDPSLREPEFYAELVVDWLSGTDEGWLFLNGKCRKVQIADRFGPASWEISTHEHPSDWQEWRPE